LHRPVELAHVIGNFTAKLLLITFMVGRWVGSLGQVMLDFRILGQNYASCGQIMVEIAKSACCSHGAICHRG
jgi:hypothetical protein